MTNPTATAKTTRTFGEIREDEEQTVKDGAEYAEMAGRRMAEGKYESAKQCLALAAEANEKLIALRDELVEAMRSSR